MMASIFDPSFHYEEAKSMAYRSLGMTDMKVSKIGLGGASFGNIEPLLSTLFIM